MDIKKPLTGLKVVDLSINIAAPGAGKILADQGADVIKVEALVGDPYRPQSAAACCSVAENENPIYDIENANKRHISLDLKSEKGIEIFYKLIENTDILITNFRDAALQALGLTYEELSPKYPRLVYGHLIGYGEKGPDTNRPGYDLICYWARTGLMLDSVAEGQVPLINIGGLGDHPTAVALAQGVTAALVRQMKIGKGDKVTVSLFHSGIWAAASLFSIGQFHNWYPVQYNKPTVTPVVHPYKCADGVWVMIMLFDYEKKWASFCKTLGRPDLVEDQRFKTFLDARTNQSALVDILVEIIGSKPYIEWADKWQAEDIPFEKLRHIMDLLEDETAKANNFIRPVTYPSGRTVYLPTPPIQFKEMGLSEFKTTTGIGSETEEILLQMGYTATAIDEMKANNIIREK